MTWQPIETCPNTNELAMFFVPGRVPFLNRADDYHSHFAHWLEGATHWMPINPPKGE